MIKRRILLVAGSLCLATATMPLHAEERVPKLLEKEAYRADLEEVLVTAQAPKWRELENPAWRPGQFELPKANTARIDWLPEYTTDERDSYPSVHEKKVEKPLMKLFEWKF